MAVSKQYRTHKAGHEIFPLTKMNPTIPRLIPKSRRPALIIVPKNLLPEKILSSPSSAILHQHISFPLSLSVQGTRSPCASTPGRTLLLLPNHRYRHKGRKGQNPPNSATDGNSPDSRTTRPSPAPRPASPRTRRRRRRPWWRGGR